MMATGVSGRVDRDGRLVAADPALLRLQERAGGALGDALMLPQLARLAALAMRLERPLSRSLLTADDQNDINASVTITPDADGAALSISDWRVSAAAAQPGAAELLYPDTDDAPPEDGWRWACDAQLRLVQLSPISAQPIGAEWHGASLSEMFALEPSEDGSFPVLTALAEQRRFTGQRVRPPISIDPARSVMLLSGQVALNGRGAFAGFVGWLVPTLHKAGESPSAAEPRIVDPAFGSLPLSDPRFGRRIDGALRGPLGRIIASAETISGQFEGPIRADYARYAADIAHAARHLLGLIDDLADLQSIERPGFHAAREAVDLADVARRAVGLLMMKAEEKRIQIDVPRVDEKVPAIGEFRRVLQILLNLIGNAIRYSPEGSQIWIRCETAADYAVVTVADQGQGLSPDQQAVVFEKFERLGRTDSGGSGLGLYIARRLARAMDGDLTVDSAPGQGARFTLRLPTS